MRLCWKDKDEDKLKNEDGEFSGLPSFEFLNRNYVHFFHFFGLNFVLN